MIDVLRLFFDNPEKTSSIKTGSGKTGPAKNRRM
jgi:hypothetical protein